MPPFYRKDHTSTTISLKLSSLNNFTVTQCLLFTLSLPTQKTPNRKINFLLYFLHHHQRIKINYISSLFPRDQFKRHLFLIYQHLIPFTALISFTHKDCGFGGEGFSIPLYRSPPPRNTGKAL